MAKRKGLGLIGIGVALPALSAVCSAQTVNFHDASQGYSFSYGGGGYNVLFYGQGAATDTGNNVWNGFGTYQGPASTVFYGTGDSAAMGGGGVPATDPGQPYSWYRTTTKAPGVTASGTTLFSQTNPGAANTGNANSDGTLSPVTLAIGGAYSGDNGFGSLGAAGAATVTQGQPNYLLGTAALTATTATFTLGSVPQGTYNLFLYGANYDNTRGAVFTVSSGTPLGGFTSTENDSAGSPTAYILGDNYVEFTGVTPTGGVISGTWSAIDNDISGLSGEGDFNGLQLQTVAQVPEPSSWVAVFTALAAGLLVRASKRRKIEEKPVV